MEFTRFAVPFVVENIGSAWRPEGMPLIHDGTDSGAGVADAMDIQNSFEERG